MKWKFQFSIRSLLWLTLCVALLLTSILMYRRMVKAETEATILRKAAGYLVIGDKKLVHGSSVPTHDDRFSWKWRLYLPTEKHFILKSTVGEIPLKAMPGNANIFYLKESGEIVLSVKIYKMSGGIWYLMYSYSNENIDLIQGAYGSTPSSSGEMQLNVSSAAAMEKIVHNSEHFEDSFGVQDFGFHSTIFGSSGIVTAKTDKAIILLKMCLNNQLREGKKDSTELSPGIMIWLEEQK